jgi:hypothetical protein
MQRRSTGDDSREQLARVLDLLPTDSDIAISKQVGRSYVLATILPVFGKYA